MKIVSAPSWDLFHILDNRSNLEKNPGFIYYFHHVFSNPYILGCIKDSEMPNLPFKSIGDHNSIHMFRFHVAFILLTQQGKT